LRSTAPAPARTLEMLELARRLRRIAELLAIEAPGKQPE
jgi:hypothetical protein